MVPQTPFAQTMANLRADLVAEVKRRNDAETRINQLSEAIEGLARTLENTTERARYLDDLRIITTRVGFAEAVRSALVLNKAGLTATEIRDFIVENAWMDLSAYSNPLASIYTTIRRNPDIEEFNKGGEKAFRLKQRKQPYISPLPPFLRSISNITSNTPAVTSGNIATPKQADSSHPFSQMKRRKGMNSPFYGVKPRS